MGRTSTSRLGAVLPKAPGSSSRDRGDGRLDPVRWRRPGRGRLLRLVVVAGLLGSAALASWPSSGDCATPPAFTVPAAKTSPGAVPAAETSAGAPSAGSAPTGDQAGQVPPGSVGVPVRLADPAALALVKAGNRVDLLRLDESGGGSTSVAESALVLRVTGSDDPAVGGLLLALTPDEAEQAVVGPGHTFAVMIRPE